MADIALVLIIVDDKILMCKREKKDNDKFSEMYGLPGGHVKKDESNKDGAIREVKEETNLTISNPKFIKTYDFDDNQIHLFTKEIKNIDGIKLNHEHTDYKLVSLKDLKNPDIIPTTKDMYKDCKDKPLNEEIQRIKFLINEDLNDYYHAEPGASPENDEYELGEGKLIHHKWSKVDDKKIKHHKCERCKAEKWWDSGFGKLIYQDRFGKTHYRAPECELPNRKL
jgi:8-oxo-dGTP pyrophosphatase MutT (NUDIX family)